MSAKEKRIYPRNKMYAKKKYFTINLIHLIQKACQILFTFTNQCHCHHLHIQCLHLHCGFVQVLFLSLIFKFYCFSNHFPVTTLGLDLF